MHIFKQKLFLLAVVLISSLIIIYNIHKSDISSIESVKYLCNKLDIDNKSELSVHRKNIIESMAYGINSKLIYSVNTRNRDIFAIYDCNSRMVTDFSNDKEDRLLKDIVKNNNNISTKFSSENAARAILSSIYAKLDLPSNLELATVTLDNTNAEWIARWIHKLHGIDYENDYVIITISAVNGELLGFSRRITNNECKTNAKITRKEAIDTAYKKFSNSFPKDLWAKNNDKFEVKSAELKIVEVKLLFNKIFNTLFSRPYEVKLAWVVEFDTKKGMENKTIFVIKNDVSFIRVDALTNNILNSDINLVF
ncbi:MAG: hypothetical protein WC156_09825 [Pedobacter sp.]